MRVGKTTGGCTLSYGGKSYTWAKDGAVIQVPRDLADDVLSIRGADFFEPKDEPEPVQPPAAVIEPAPVEAAVTEPAPPPKAAVTEGPAKSAPKA